LVDALAPLTSVGIMSAAAHVNLQFLTSELGKGIDAAFDEVTQYVAQVAAGSTEIRTEAPAPPPAPPAPTVERLSIIALRPSKWMDVDGIRTVGRLCQCDPPTAVARRALELRNAVAVDSAEYRKLREVECADFAYQHESGCHWLDRPRPAPQPLEVHATTPLVHSALPGQPRVGTAVATPLR
jgi:hypothetical protein